MAFTANAGQEAYYPIENKQNRSLPKGIAAMGQPVSVRQIGRVSLLQYGRCYPAGAGIDTGDFAEGKSMSGSERIM